MKARVTATVSSVMFGVMLSSTGALATQPNGISLGKAEAPVVIHAYMDYMCPFCANSFITLQGLQREYPDTLRVQYHFSPNRLSDASVRLTKLAYCAHTKAPQADSWQLSRQLYSLPMGYKEKLYLTHKTLRQLGINEVKAVISCVNDTRLANIADFTRIKTLKFKGTPGFFVEDKKNKTNLTLEGHRSQHQWRQLLSIKKAAD